MDEADKLAMLHSLLRTGLTWSEARQAIKRNEKLQETLKELRQEARARDATKIQN